MDILYLIASREHIPGAILKRIDALPEDQRSLFSDRIAWKYNSSEVISKETAETLAKSSHGICNGKGWIERSRVPSDNQFVFFDRIEFCECSIKNAVKMGL